MKQVGLSQTEAGIIYGTTPFIGALVRPVFGAIADKYNKHKFVLMLCVILTGILHACLSALPHHPVSTEVYNSSQVMVNMQCGTADSHIEFCPVDSLSHMGCTYEQKHPVSAHSREHLSGQVFTKYNSSSENDSYHELYNITYTTGKEFDPLENLRNCSFRCRFDDPGQSHSVCVKNSQNDSAQPVCPLTKAQDKKLGASIGHGIDPKALKNFFEMSIFVEHLFKIGTKNSDNPEKECYKYVANHFDYHNRAFDQDWVLYCDSKTSLTCRMDCHESPLNFTALDEFNCPKQTPENPKYGRIFWMFFLLFLMAQIFFAPVFTLIDGVVYSYLGEDRRFWGKSRLFGTVGYIVLGVTSGLIMDVYVGDDGTKNYTVAFVLFPVLNFIAAVMVCLFQLSDDVKCGQIFDNMLGLFKDIQVLTLLVIVLVFGIDNGVIETFLFWHLQDAGASQLLLGLCMMMNCILEIFILFFASVILKKIGHINCFYIVFTAYFLRLLSYSFLTNPWFALLIEPLHSITFGLFYATATSHGSIITPPGMHGTVQGLIGGMFFGIGRYLLTMK